MWHSESHGRLKKLIDDIIKENDWIVEGSPRKVLKESFDCCDNVIVLDEYTIIRLVRVFKRWIRQRRGRESYNSRPTWDFLWLNIKWVFEFNRMKKGLLQELSTYGVKTLKLDIPLVPKTRINWAFVLLHIAIIYILKLCLDEEIIPRCRFPCSRGYLTKCINWQKKQ